MRITALNGREIVSVEAQGRLKGYGLTELFSESSEPPFDVFPLDKFKTLFPEGRYAFVGETIEGRKVTGSAKLSHDVPDGPKIVSPRRRSPCRSERSRCEVGRASGGRRRRRRGVPSDRHA
jgi:hypothetical protein